MAATIPMPASVINFDEMLSKLDFGIDDFKRWIDKIIRDCTRWAPWLVPVAKWMSEAVRWLVDNVGKLLSEIGRFFTQPGHPVALWENGNRWVAEVGKRAGDQVGVITVGFMNADDKWKGDAADAYLKGLPLQSGAAAQVHTVCEKMQGSLHDLALAIAGFWLGTLIAVGKVIAELIPEAAATAVPPTAPAGLAGAVASVAGFIALWGTVVLAFHQFVASLFEEQANLINQLHDNRAFPGPPAGTWPKSTTQDFSDAVWNDSDKSDWQMR
jgi:hypothetical protein